MRGRRAGSVGLLLTFLLTAAELADAGTPESEHAARALKARQQDVDDLRRVAKWGDENGLERTAIADWERVLRFSPDDETVRKRLRFLRRSGAWVRDDASWALALATPDSKPDRAPEYASRWRSEVGAPAAARQRELAIWSRAEGLLKEAQVHLEQALEHDPDDLWSRLALGEVIDPEEGWVSADLRARRIADAGADATVRRLLALRSEPVREEADAKRSEAVGKPLSSWKLREWRLETDLPDEQAAAVLAAVDLGARWFRDFFDIPTGSPVLPGEGVFVVLTTSEAYAKAVAAEPALTPAEKKFANDLSAYPVPHKVDSGPWVVLIERPDGLQGADAALHYAMHFLFQARYGVESQEAWLYEGLAAYATLRLVGTQGSWCVRLEETSSAIGSDRAPSPETWGAQAAAQAMKRDDFPLKGLVGASLNGLDGPMLIKSWSLLRWMLEEHPQEARAFLEAKRDGEKSERALRMATGLHLDEIDAAWRLHMEATGGE